MVVVNLRTLEWGRQWYQVALIFSEVVLGRDIHWEIHLGHNMELRKAPLARCGVLLVQNMEMRYEPLVICQVERQDIM